MFVLKLGHHSREIGFKKAAAKGHTVLFHLAGEMRRIELGQPVGHDGAFFLLWAGSSAPDVRSMSSRGLLGALGFERFEPFLHGFQVVAQPHATHAGGRDYIRTSDLHYIVTGTALLFSIKIGVLVGCQAPSHKAIWLCQ